MYQWSKEDQQYQLLPATTATTTTTATATQPAGAALADQSADEHLAHEPPEHRGHSPHGHAGARLATTAAAAAASGSVKSGRSHFPDHSAADGGCQPAESADCPIESADSTVYQ